MNKILSLISIFDLKYSNLTFIIENLYLKKHLHLNNSHCLKTLKSYFCGVEYI